MLTTAGLGDGDLKEKDEKCRIRRGGQDGEEPHSTRERERGVQAAGSDE